MSTKIIAHRRQQLTNRTHQPSLHEALRGWAVATETTPAGEDLRHSPDGWSSRKHEGRRRDPPNSKHRQVFPHQRHGVGLASLPTKEHRAWLTSVLDAALELASDVAKEMELDGDGDGSESS